ncbi:hypothetical protein Ddye_008477 [Dipteronia dyeriana]|uniref:Transposase MuDR plant domain-containing protein n=1 Tax=Dipteronia dyeriana TaxID=168575 RepID=A0AAD9X9K2_9ROSI|nr:hypothetical protein Ddye_008477 [Dipteronia dyeriana]
MDIFEIVVHFEKNILELGHWDVEHISIISLLHVMIEKNNGVRCDPHKDDFIICVQLPWCEEKLEAKDDKDMLEVFEMFRQHRATRIVFEVDYKLYKHVAPELSSSLPNGPPQVLPFNDDEFFNDFDDENAQVRMSKLIKCKRFQQIVGVAIKFEVGQTHNTVDSLRDLLREYAIQEGINFDKVKNDKNKLTFKCKAHRCPSKIHASCMQNDITMMVKTYIDKHDCLKVYKVQEARVKWIESKFEALVKSNPDINKRVIEEILRERYKVTVDTQRLYKAEKRVLGCLGRDHTEDFKYLKKYAYMVQQCNPGSKAYIHLQSLMPAFQRFVMSFKAQKEGVMTGCRPFIGLDGCHLKGLTKEFYYLLLHWIQMVDFFNLLFVYVNKIPLAVGRGSWSSCSNS